MACPFGKGPNRATNTCEDCQADGTIDWGPVTDKACHTDQVTEMSSPGDFCPEEFWVRALNLNGTSSGGRNSDFMISGNLATDIADAAQCLDTDVFVTVAERQGGALVPIGQVQSLNPSVCQSLCPAGTCVHYADIILPFSQVTAGRTEVWVRARASNSTSTLLGAVMLSTSNCGSVPP